MKLIGLALALGLLLAPSMSGSKSSVKWTTAQNSPNSCVMPGMLCQSIMDVCCTTGGFCGGTLMCH